MNANRQSFSRRSEIDTPSGCFLCQVQAGEANEAFRILSLPCWGVGDNRQIACEFPIELHFARCIPGCRMKEKKRAASDGQSVPYGIPTANVVQLVTQNIFEFGAILFQTECRQKDRWPNPAERCRRSCPR